MHGNHLNVCSSSLPHTWRHLFMYFHTLTHAGTGDTRSHSRPFTHTPTSTAECWLSCLRFAGKSAADGSLESIALRSFHDLHSARDAAAIYMYSVIWVLEGTRAGVAVETEEGTSEVQRIYGIDESLTVKVSCTDSGRLLCAHQQMIYSCIIERLNHCNRADSNINDVVSVHFIISCKCQRRSYGLPIISAQSEKGVFFFFAPFSQFTSHLHFQLHNWRRHYNFLAISLVSN